MSGWLSWLWGSSKSTPVVPAPAPVVPKAEPPRLKSALHKNKPQTPRKGTIPAPANAITSQAVSENASASVWSIAANHSDDGSEVKQGKKSLDFSGVFSPKRNSRNEDRLSIESKNDKFFQDLAKHDWSKEKGQKKISAESDGGQRLEDSPSEHSINSLMSNMIEDELIEDGGGWVLNMSDEDPEEGEEEAEGEKEGPHQAEVDADVFHIEDDRDPFYAPYGFIIMCAFQIVWGVLGVLQVAVLRYLKSSSIKFMVIDKQFSDHSPFYLFVGAILTILSGICGIIALIFEIPALLHLIPHLMWIIITLCLGSSVAASGNWDQPTIPTYYRLFEAVDLFPTDPKPLKLIWPEHDDKIWDELQKEMRCCGVESATDWLRLPVPKLPTSCCISDPHTCGKIMDSWLQEMQGKGLAEMMKQFGKIKNLIFDDSCIGVLEIERVNNKRDWTTYPLIYLAFHLLIMLNLNYLTQLLLNEYRCWQGLARLQLFKSQSTDLMRSRLVAALWSLFPFVNSKKKRAQTDLEKKVEVSQESLFASVTDAQEMKKYTMKTPQQDQQQEDIHHHHRRRKQRPKVVDPEWERKKQEQDIKRKLGITNKTYLVQNPMALKPPSMKDFQHTTKRKDFSTARDSFGSAGAPHPLTPITTTGEDDAKDNKQDAKEPAITSWTYKKNDNDKK